MLNERCGEELSNISADNISIKKLANLLWRLLCYAIFVVLVFVLIVSVVLILPVAMWVYIPIHSDLKYVITVFWIIAMILAFIGGLEVFE